MVKGADYLLDHGAGPYFYLPKLESYHEARLWNDVFDMAQDELGIDRAAIVGHSMGGMVATRFARGGVAERAGDQVPAPRQRAASERPARSRPSESSAPAPRKQDVQVRPRRRQAVPERIA